MGVVLERILEFPGLNSLPLFRISTWIPSPIS